MYLFQIMKTLSTPLDLQIPKTSLNIVNSLREKKHDLRLDLSESRFCPADYCVSLRLNPDGSKAMCKNGLLKEDLIRCELSR